MKSASRSRETTDELLLPSYFPPISIRYFYRIFKRAHFSSSPPPHFLLSVCGELWTEISKEKKKKKKEKNLWKKKRKRKGRENLFAGSICNFKPPRAFYRQESGNYFGGERGPDVAEIWKRLRIPAKSTLHDYGSLSRIPNKDSGRLKGAD